MAAAPDQRVRAPTRRVGLIGILMALGVLVLQLAWVVTVPPFAGIDEIDHAFRSSSVGEGHLRPDYVRVAPDRGRGDLIPVRSDVAAAARGACKALRYNGPDNCVPVASAGRDQVLIASSAARYNPTFYVATGFGSKAFHGAHTVLAMRVVSLAMSLLLLGATGLVLLRRSRTPWPAILLLTALTPTVLYSTSLATPNGLNIVSGASVWVALLALYADAEPPTRQGPLLALAAIGSVLLLNTHSLGVLWLPLIVATVIGLSGVRRVRARVSQAPGAHAVAVLVVLAGLVAAGLWVVAARTNNPYAEPVVLQGPIVPKLVLGTVLWPLQAFAAFPSRGQSADPAVYAIGLALVIGLGWFALTRVTARIRWTVLAVVVISYAVPLALTVLTFDRLGLAWQGRYDLPFAIGLFLLLGHGLDARRAPAPRWVAPVLAAAVVLQQLFSWRGVIRRVDRMPLWHDSTIWHAPSLALLVGLALLSFALLTPALTLLTGERRDP